jgi:hypothetical protein
MQGIKSCFLSAVVLYSLVNLACSALPKNPPQDIARAKKNLLLTPAVLEEGRPASYWLARAYLNEPAAPEVVVFGSSQIGGLQAADANKLGRRIDYVLDRHCSILEDKLVRPGAAKKNSVVLLATAGAVTSDHFFVAKSLFANGRAPQAVVLTVSPREFIDNTLPCPGATEPYRFHSQYCDVDPYLHLAFNTLKSRFEHYLSRELPLKRFVPTNETIWEISAFCDRVLPVSLDTGAADAGIADSAAQNSQSQLKLVTGAFDGNLRPGVAVVEPRMPAIYVDNLGDYRRRYKHINASMYKTQMAFYRELLAYLQSKHVKTLVLAMPLTEANRKLLPQDFLANFNRDLQEGCSEHKAGFVDLSASKDFQLADFCDSVHLNARGGEKLAGAIGKEMQCF